MVGDRSTAYAKRADSYDRSWSWYAEACWNSMLPMIPDLAGKWVLDVGCGTALITDRLANEVGTWGQVVGIDGCQEMLDKARVRMADRRNVALHRAPAHQVPSRDRSFDVIVSTSVIHGVDDLVPVVREWRRVLNMNGEIVLLDWDPSAFPIRCLHHWCRFMDKAYARTWSSHEAQTVLKNHGFAIIDAKSVSLSRFWKVWLIRARKK